MSNSFILFPYAYFQCLAIDGLPVITMLGFPMNTISICMHELQGKELIFPGRERTDIHFRREERTAV